jgi:Amt family ammonium transporter
MIAISKFRKIGPFALSGLLVSTNTVFAADTPKLDTGDTAWMLTSTVLVLMMTIPGLALFYGGMVRKKNVLSTIMQSFAVTCLMTVLWMVIGYSLAFTDGGSANAFVGGLSNIFLTDMKLDTINGTIPDSVFMTFQMTFAIITPALISGAFADRMKFSSMLVFLGAWMILVYAPITHWVWGGGFLAEAGVLDFAGGKRKGYRTENMAPHNLILSVIGASLLWVGWFGFNAGSAVGANATAGMAMAVTQICAAAAALSWMFAEWIYRGKPSILGIISGAISGLVCITPAAGFVGPTGALIMGFIAGIGCFWGATFLKQMLGYDDSLDAFGVHGVGGIIGALLTGVFALKEIGGTSGLLEGNAAQVWIQLEGIIATIVYCAVATFIILKIVQGVMGLRVDEDAEVEGLDINLHGETVQ